MDRRSEKLMEASLLLVRAARAVEVLKKGAGGNDEIKRLSDWSIELRRMANECGDLLSSRWSPADRRGPVEAEAHAEEETKVTRRQMDYILDQVIERLPRELSRRGLR